VDEKIAGATTVFALLEMMADLSPDLPDRIERGPLAGRIVAGAVVGAAAAQMTGRDRRTLGIAGALAAFAGTHATFRLRRSLSESIHPFAAALVEDVIVVSLAAMGSRLLARRVTASSLPSVR
jgi:uncharacterized membrane protein